MMIKNRVAIALMMVAPAVVFAQRGGGALGGMGGGLDGPTTSSSGPSEPTDAQLGAVNTKDVDKLNPVSIMLDKKKDLKLSDSTVKILKSMETTLKDTNKVRFKIIDSLNKQLHARDWRNPTDDDRTRAQNATHSLDDVTTEIRLRYDAAKARAYSFLTPDEQTEATAAIQKEWNDVHTAEVEAMRPSNTSFGMGGSTGGRPSRGAPKGGGNASSASMSSGPQAPLIWSSDLQKVNPVAIVLANRSAIGYPDSITPRLQEDNQTLLAMIGPSLKTVDSLDAASQPALGTARPSTKNPMVDSLIAQIQSQFDVARARAFTMLTMSQSATAATLIDKARKTVLPNSGRGP